MLPLAVDGRFEIPSLSDPDTATTRALDETQEAVAQLRSVAFDRGPGYLSFRLTSLAQLWRRTAPAPGRYTLRIISDGDSLFAVYEVRSTEMVFMSVALSVLPLLSEQLFQRPFRVLVFAWFGVVWLMHTANMLLARRWFRRLLQGVLIDPLRMKFHGV